VLQPGSVQFGVVDQCAPVQREINVSSLGSRDLRIVGVRSGSPYLAATLVPTGGGWGQSYRLVAQLADNAPAGYLNEYLMLVASDGRTQIPVPVEGVVRAAIAVSPTWLFMGEVQPGQKVVKQIVVRGKEPFVITKVNSPLHGFTVDLSGAQTPKMIHVLPVTFLAGSSPGKVKDAIHIETNVGRLAADLVAEAIVSRSDSNVVQAQHTEPVDNSPQDTSGSTVQRHVTALPPTPSAEPPRATYPVPPVPKAPAATQPNTNPPPDRQDSRRSSQSNNPDNRRLPLLGRFLSARQTY
jgi:hypothetical protein